MMRFGDWMDFLSGAYTEAEIQARIDRRDETGCRRCSGLGTVERLAVAGGSFPVCPVCNGTGRKQT